MNIIKFEIIDHIGQEIRMWENDSEIHVTVLTVNGVILSDSVFSGLWNSETAEMVYAEFTRV
jgi:hypothetical protein